MKNILNIFESIYFEYSFKLVENICVSVNEDCSSNRACINNRCVDACAGTCASNALCETRNHVPVCYCPPGYAGDPFTRCEIEDPCKKSPCGVNTKCEVINTVPTCSCLPGYIGQPLSGCRHECESDNECPQNKACSASFRCENPCKCGDNANCEVVNHQAKCTCPPVSSFLLIQSHKKIRL